MRGKIALVMLAVGVVLLWVVPLGGALVLVTAAMGLAIAWEEEFMEGAAPIPLTVEPPDNLEWPANS